MSLENVTRIVGKMLNKKVLAKRKKSIRKEIQLLSKSANQHELRSMNSWTR
jgi:hypothetical protein